MPWPEQDWPTNPHEEAVHDKRQVLYETLFQQVIENRNLHQVIVMCIAVDVGTSCWKESVMYT